MRSDESREEMAQDLLELARLEHLEVRLSNPSFSLAASPAPRVEALTRYEAERGPAVTTPQHTVLAFDPFARVLVQYLDGSRRHGELVERMSHHADPAEISLSDESGQPLTGTARTDATVELVERTIETLPAKRRRRRRRRLIDPEPRRCRPRDRAAPRVESSARLAAVEGAELVPCVTNVC